jgi:hypothetical protein
MKTMLKMNILRYFKQVIIPISAVTILAFILPTLFYYSFSPSFWRVVGVAAVTLISSALIIYLVGLTKGERNGLRRVLFSKITGRKG